MPSCQASFFSRDQLKLKVSVHTRNAAKTFSERPLAITCHHLRIHDTTRKPFLNIVFLVLAWTPFKRWKISSFFLMSSCSSCLCSSSLQARWEFVMSRCHTRGSIVGERKRPYFLTFSFIFARFCRFACFGRFGGFARFVSLFRVLVHALKETKLVFRVRASTFTRNRWSKVNPLDAKKTWWRKGRDWRRSYEKVWRSRLCLVLFLYLKMSMIHPSISQLLSSLSRIWDRYFRIVRNRALKALRTLIFSSHPFDVVSCLTSYCADRRFWYELFEARRI